MRLCSSIWRGSRVGVDTRHRAEHGESAKAGCCRFFAEAVRTPRRSARWLVGAGIITITTAILGARAPPPQALPAVPSKPRAIVAAMVMAIDEPRSLVDRGWSQRCRMPTGRREQAAINAVTQGRHVIDPLLSARIPMQVREKAAIGLAFRRDPKIIDPLLTAMEDGDSQVR
jgi:hypothetical protein